jgi:hypothetical protein
MMGLSRYVAIAEAANSGLVLNLLGAEGTLFHGTMFLLVWRGLQRCRSQTRYCELTYTIRLA